MRQSLISRPFTSRRGTRWRVAAEFLVILVGAICMRIQSGNQVVYFSVNKWSFFGALPHIKCACLLTTSFTVQEPSEKGDPLSNNSSGRVQRRPPRFRTSLKSGRFVTLFVTIGRRSYAMMFSWKMKTSTHRRFMLLCVCKLHWMLQEQHKENSCEPARCSGTDHIEP